MAGYYPSTCEDIIPSHNCDPCADREYGRIRSGFFVHKSYIATLLAGITNPQVWLNGINAGKIIIIPGTNGDLADPSELTGPGYGDQTETLLGYDFQALMVDPNYAENCDFYNALKSSRNYHFGYRTSSKVHITDKTVTIIPKAPVQNDLTAEVTWNVTVKWSSSEHPCPVDTPEGIFDCYILED